MGTFLWPKVAKKFQKSHTLFFLTSWQPKAARASISYFYDYSLLFFSPNIDFSCEDDSHCNGHGTCEASTCVCEVYEDLNGNQLLLDMKDCASNINHSGGQSTS